MLLVCSLLCWVYILLACGGGCWLSRRSHFYCHWKPGNPARQVEEDRCNHQITHVKPTQDMGNIIAHSTVSVSASNTHTLVLYYHCQNWLCGPHLGVSQKKATRLVAPLAAGTPASFSQLHGHLSAVGVLIYGLARPMR